MRSIVAVVLAATFAQASDLVIHLPADVRVERRKIAFQCDATAVKLGDLRIVRAA